MWPSGSFGLVKTTGSATIFSSFRSKTSKLTTRLLALLFSFSIVVSDSVVGLPDRPYCKASSSEQKDVFKPLSKNA